MKNPTSKPATAPDASAAEISGALFHRREHRIVEEIRSGVNGEHLPAAALLDGDRGPTSRDIVHAAVVHLVTFLHGQDP